MRESEDMTKPVIFKTSGKVQGIKGLYRDPSSKRMYVRFSFHGIDKQKTITPKNMTFSELERSAAKAMNELKKDVKGQVPEVSNAEKRPSVSALEYGIKQLPQEISKHWGCRGTSQKYIRELLRVTDGMAICTTKRQFEIAEIDRHNKSKARERIEQSGLSQCQKFKLYNGIRQCFDKLIELRLHNGCNPIIEIPRPIYVQGRKTSVLDLETAAHVIHEIRSDKDGDEVRNLEMELFFRLCVETGQRPKDIYMFDALKISDKHYQFRSHKTRREQRVMHLLSDNTMMLIGNIMLKRGGEVAFNQTWENKHGSSEQFTCFWRLSFASYTQYINKVIHLIAGNDVSLYSAKHFFITEMFRRTNSEFWAEVFTHEGRTVNQRNYLHPEQKKADEILTGFTNDFQSEINKLL